MSESRVLSQIQAAFEPYIKTPGELRDVRIQIAKYISSLQPRNQDEDETPHPFSIPSHVIGIRRQYLKALHANIIAKQEYRRLQNSIRIRTTVTPDGENNVSTNKIQDHLTLLSLRRQYQKYQVLNHYLSRAEDLASENNIFDPQPPVNDPVNYHLDAAPSTDNLPASLRAKDLTRDLEIAILQANHRLNHERQALEELKTSGDIPTDPSPEAKLQALVATNRELTRWIEESLAKCDAANGDESRFAAPMEVPDKKQDKFDRDTMISEQYERYIEARKRVLDAATELTSPLPDSASRDSAAKEHKSQIGVESSRPAATKTRGNTASVIPYLESHHIPLHLHRNGLQQAQTHIDSVLSNHAQRLMEQLHRLSDESHLLPSYPILVKSKKGDAEANEVEKLLHAWNFAMDAASTATVAGIEKQIKSGEGAVDDVHTALDRLEEEQELWSKLEQPRR